MKKERNYSFLMYIIIAIPFFFLIGVIMTISANFDKQIDEDNGVNIKFTDDSIHLKGVITQDSFKINDITNVTLYEQNLEGSRKGGGIITDNYANGDIYVNGIGMTRTYVYSDIPLYIKVEDAKKIFIINQENTNKTLEIYNKILELRKDLQ